MVEIKDIPDDKLIYLLRFLIKYSIKPLAVSPREEERDEIIFIAAQKDINWFFKQILIKNCQQWRKVHTHVEEIFKSKQGCGGYLSYSMDEREGKFVRLINIDTLVTRSHLILKKLPLFEVNLEWAFKIIQNFNTDVFFFLPFFWKMMPFVIAWWVLSTVTAFYKILCFNLMDQIWWILRIPLAISEFSSVRTFRSFFFSLCNVSDIYQSGTPKIIL